MADLEYFIDPENPPIADLNRRTEIISLVQIPMALMQERLDEFWSSPRC